MSSSGKKITLPTNYEKSKTVNYGCNRTGKNYVCGGYFIYMAIGYDKNFTAYAFYKKNNMNWLA